MSVGRFEGVVVMCVICQYEFLSYPVGVSLHMESVSRCKIDEPAGDSKTNNGRFDSHQLLSLFLIILCQFTLLT